MVIFATDCRQQERWWGVAWNTHRLGLSLGCWVGTIRKAVVVQASAQAEAAHKSIKAAPSVFSPVGLGRAMFKWGQVGSGVLHLFCPIDVKSKAASGEEKQASPLRFMSEIEVVVPRSRDQIVNFGSQ